MSEREETQFLTRTATGATVVHTIATSQTDLTLLMEKEFSSPAEGQPPSLDGPQLDPRYKLVEVLGRGGMAVVYRAFDETNHRTVAIKIGHDTEAQSSLLEEGRLTARLQHPNIVPIYEVHRNETQAYYSMKLLDARSLRSVLLQIQQGVESIVSAWPLPRLLEAFRQVCLGVHFAHVQGVIHRDLKPDNIMLGHYGEVVVADWGIARPFHQGDSTQSTKVFGTPAHIAPEQLRQEFAAGDFKTDVYSLGSCLYEILTLAPPRSGSWIEVISLVRSTKITAPRKAGSPFDLPEGLDEVCMRALSADRDHRFESAEEFAREIEAILDRSRDRKLRAKRASELVARAQEMGNNSNKEKARAQKLIADARRYLSNVQPWQSENDKEEGWALEDAAEEIRLARQRTSVEVEQVLRAALTHDPNHSSTHRALANHYRDIHNRAELSQDRAEAIRAEALMRFHTDSLKTGDPEKARHKRYLAGRGYISLRTEPDNARITICRYETRKRRLVAAKIDDNIHPAPLDNFWLPIGTYLAQIECDGFHNTIYPFTIGRDQKWRPKRPGSDQPTLIRLLEEGQVKPEEAYIPAGWFQCGGDPQASGTLPQRQVWIDDFVIQKFPVTNREYLIFLNDLAQSNREAEALQYAPRQRPGKAGGQGPLIYSYEDQTFGLQEDADGHLLRPEWPVVMVDWYGACGYADWFSDRTSQPYRLPTELEWEKAARGVDGRFHPWGDFLDPSWCCIRDSHPEDPKPCDVESFPVDVSVYGVRGMAGNSRDWCLSAYREEGPLLEEGIAKTDSLRERNEDQTTPRIFRGGCCYYFAQFSRCATRVWYSPFFRFGSLGFRLARSIAPDE